MINPDVMPPWLAVPAAVIAWALLLGPIVRDHLRARRGR